jgi:hypothetical protein
MVKDLLYDEFQSLVASHLVQSKSILDASAKLAESNGRVQRAIARSVTQCGCIQVEASRQRIPEVESLEELSRRLDSHVRGQLCEDCREQVETEIGNLLVYAAAVCELLGISLYDCVLREEKRVQTLGMFHLT